MLIALLDMACSIPGCPWTVRDLSPLAASLGVWHSYEDHPDLWAEMFGDGPPLDPDPRIPVNRRRLLAGLS